jgi:hypothetical protein
MSKFVSVLGNDDSVSDEIYLARLRYWRDQELASTDWTQVSDSPANKAAWATYRQSLRDLPDSNSDPRKIALPNRPS